MEKVKVVTVALVVASLIKQPTGLPAAEDKVTEKAPVASKAPLAPIGGLVKVTQYNLYLAAPVAAKAPAGPDVFATGEVMFNFPAKVTSLVVVVEELAVLVVVFLHPANEKAEAARRTAANWVIFRI